MLAVMILRAVSEIYFFLLLLVCESSQELIFCYPLWLQGVGSAINKLNDVVAMIAEVRSISEALGMASINVSKELRIVHH
jgi:hypothetical protein